jgi:N-acetylglutamate synthase-like GNAT family acetyltransferase
MMVTEMEILFAQPKDEEELRAILIEHHMDIAGNVEEHVILKQDGVILAGGKVSELEDDLYHLEVFGVKQDVRGSGAGTMLLTRMVGEPWKYSLSPATGGKEKYRITTVARGEAVNFYKKCGFEPYSFSELAWPYSEQCDDCPERDECNPIPMIYKGGGA